MPILKFKSFRDWALVYMSPIRRKTARKLVSSASLVMFECTVTRLLAVKGQPYSLIGKFNKSGYVSVHSDQAVGCQRSPIFYSYSSPQNIPFPPETLFVAQGGDEQTTATGNKQWLEG